MKPTFLTFNAVVNANVHDSMMRARIVAAAVGLALCNAAPLPTSAVDNPASFFVSTVQPSANNALSQLNENVIFDCKTACEFFRSFWLMRYAVAHPLSRPLYAINDCFFDSICGVGNFVSPQSQEFLNKYGKEVLIVAMAASEVFAELASCNG